MIKNYIKIAWRNLYKHKVFTIINIIGLTIGISAALVIYLIVNYDFTFDKFEKDNDRLYRVVTNFNFQGEKSHSGGVTGAMADAVKNEVTGVEITAPFYTIYQSQVKIPNSTENGIRFKNQNNIILADGKYFEIIPYKWLAGTLNTALNEPYKVVLTSNQAKLYYPSLTYTQMIGKQVIYEDTIKATISGIVESIKENTDFKFHDFISFSTINSVFGWKEQIGLTRWNSTVSGSQLLVKIAKNVAPTNIERQINSLAQKHHPQPPSERGSFTLQPLSDLHFNKDYDGFDTGVGRVANKTTLYGLLILAAFLLLLGCINFINLTTAQSSQRAKEIGIRKTLGVSRIQLILQFLNETFIIALFAVLIAIGLTPFILHFFTDFIPEGVTANFLKPDVLLFLAALILLVTLFAGFYPAFVLSGYKPVSVLKNQANENNGKTRNAWMRKTLTVAQFTIAQFFIMATLLVSKQVYYALHKDLGFKKEAIVNIYLPYKAVTESNRQVFLNKIQALPQIENVSVGGMPPSSGGVMATVAEYKSGKKEIKTEIEEKFGDENYLKIYNLKLLAGHNYVNSDSSKAILINSTYSKALGFKSPAGALGIFLDINGTKAQIKGVVADFYQKSLRTGIKPLIVTMPNRYNNKTLHIALKPQVTGNEWITAITGMEKAWKQVYPADEIDYRFFDDSIAKFYENERHTSTLLSWATGLSILISCLGLLGLAIYTTQLRTKEIGIRKVLGASVNQIVKLLSAELTILVLISFVLVSPIALWAMNKWMQNFVDRTPISWWIFMLSGIGMLLIAFLTLSFQTVKAALANPVKSLRSE